MLVGCIKTSYIISNGLIPLLGITAVLYAPAIGAHSSGQSVKFWQWTQKPWSTMAFMCSHWPLLALVWPNGHVTDTTLLQE